MKLSRQKLSKYFTEFTLTTDLLLMSAHLHYPFRMLQSFRKWGKGIDIHPEDDTSYTTQFKEAIPNYVKNEYYAKHRREPVNKPENVPRSNLIPSAMASESSQSTFNSYDSSRDDDDYLTPNNVAEMTPRRSDLTACILTAARLYLNSPLKAHAHIWRCRKVYQWTRFKM